MDGDSGRQKGDRVVEGARCGKKAGGGNIQCSRVNSVCFKYGFSSVYCKKVV